jgi:hypothetical protein
MAVVTGVIESVEIVRAPGVTSSIGLAQVLFSLSGTYAQADDGIIEDVDGAIQNAQQNGKTVTMLGASPGQHSYNATTGVAVGVGACAISSDDVTFPVTLSTTKNAVTTEFTNATALPSLSQPLGIFVSFVES